MSSTPVKKAGSRTTSKKRPQPHDASKRPKAHAKQAAIAPASPSRSSDTASSSSSSLSPSSTTNTTSPHTPQFKRPVYTIRHLAEQVMRKKYPYFTPRNDWELLYLSSAPWRGSEAGLYEHLDSNLALDMQGRGSYETIVGRATKDLDEVVDPTGAKPEIPGDPHVFVRPIPNSEYSIRLFPGNFESRDYCLDFVLTSTGEAVNSPFKFDLLCLPDPDAPMGSAPIIGMRPLEHSFGIPQHEIDPGAEKFLLHDGQYCLLRRPGHRDLRFTVSIRRRPQPRPRPINTDFIDLPKYID